MPFPPAFLDELNNRNPIEDVVGQYVTLTRKGSNLFGLCPFHSEKTPSFSVAPDKGIYYCFGCHKGGGAVNFIMEIPRGFRCCPAGNDIDRARRRKLRRRSHSTPSSRM